MSALRSLGSPTSFRPPSTGRLWGRLSERRGGARRSAGPQGAGGVISSRPSDRAAEGLACERTRANDDPGSRSSARSEARTTDLFTPPESCEVSSGVFQQSRSCPLVVGGQPHAQHRLARPQLDRDSPRCRPATMRREMSRPSPVPWPTPLVVKNGSKARSFADGSVHVPESAISTTTPSRSGRVASRSVPLPSMASRALVMRFVQTWFSSPGMAAMTGVSGS